MKSQAHLGNCREANVEALAVAVFKDEKADAGFLKELDELTGGGGGQIAALVKAEEIKGEAGETTYLVLPPSGDGATKIGRLLLVGVGAKDDYKLANVAVLAGAAARFLSKKNIKSFGLAARSDENAAAVASRAAQGIVTGGFELSKYKTIDKNNKQIENFVFCAENGANEDEINEGLKRGQMIGESINFTRDLCNEPPNILTPTEMANRARQMAEEVGLKCEILDEEQMEKLGMGSLLSVSRGSAQPAKLIVLRYEPAAETSTAKEGELLSFVGKGITFDTGGISLKPGEGMEAMKYDMSGGGAVIGAMRAVGLLKPTIPVLGIVAAVENMPGGQATRPSDIVTAMNGKTIEILNTDAEGRLILADAVAYAEQQGATRIVDMATLTGAVIIALGEHNTGILGNDQDLINQIIECGKEAGENFWQLPVGKEYSKMIKSDIADIKNIGAGRKAGTIIGAVFIQEFVDKAKWAHLDIAGTAWADDVKSHQSKGPTGVPIRTLLKLVERSQ